MPLRRSRAETSLLSLSYSIPVAVVNMRGRHAESRSEVKERFFQVWTMRDRKIVGFHEYKSRQEAFEAAGLKE